MMAWFYVHYNSTWMRHMYIVKTICLLFFPVSLVGSNKNFPIHGHGDGRVSLNKQGRCLPAYCGMSAKSKDSWEEIKKLEWDFSSSLAGNWMCSDTQMHVQPLLVRIGMQIKYLKIQLDHGVDPHERPQHFSPTLTITFIQTIVVFGTRQFGWEKENENSLRNSGG